VSARPEMKRGDAVRMIAAAGISAARTPVLLVRRGYYRDSMGVPGKNDVGIYDDAIFLITPDRFLGWRANADPSRLFPDVATLAPGVYTYEIGIHNRTKETARQYRALIQRSAVTVRRHGGEDETGHFGVNIHRGGVNGTTSLGCITLPPGSWPEFFEGVEMEMKRWDVKYITVVVSEREDAR
jgi:hypothetical protein